MPDESPPTAQSQISETLAKLSETLAGVEPRTAAEVLRATARVLEATANQIEQVGGDAQDMPAEAGPRLPRIEVNDLPDDPSAFLAQEPGAADDDSIFVANGLFADTGAPLCQFEAREAKDFIFGFQFSDERKNERDKNIAQKKTSEQEDHYGVVGDIDPTSLSESGWGIVFAAHEKPDVYLKALEPLLEQRRKDLGRDIDIFSGKRGVQWQQDDQGEWHCESCAQWLARHGVAAGAVDPRKGVPYYLMLVGSPSEIPFDFQYELDIFWAVGRLHFETPKELRAYAEAVVRYETGAAVEQDRRVALFAPKHDGDAATQKFVDLVATPMSSGDRVLGSNYGYELETYVSADATKSQLGELLSGSGRRANPALLFSGAHGLAMRPKDEEKLTAMQGSLVCQDWTGSTTERGRVQPEAIFAAQDLGSEARLDGLIHFNFACYGAGWPMKETIARPGRTPQPIASKPDVARLPQQMLRRGALASLGHVDKAWPNAFESASAGAQLQNFRDVLDRLLNGERVGQATDAFDQRKAQLSYELIQNLPKFGLSTYTDDNKIASLWTAREDAKSYVVLGDPAVRLREEILK